jgi:hypothetical protein
VQEYVPPVILALEQSAQTIFNELKEAVRADASTAFPSYPLHRAVSKHHTFTPSLCPIIVKIIQINFKINPTISSPSSAANSSPFPIKDFAALGQGRYKYFFTVTWLPNDSAFFPENALHQPTFQATPNALAEKLWADRQVAQGEDLVELRIGKTSEKVHRLVLVTFSPFFAATFANNMVEKQKGVMEIQELDPIACQVALEFIYKGKVSGTHLISTIHEIYKVAEQWDLPKLKEWCLDEVFAWVEKNPIDKENFDSHLQLALDYDHAKYRLYVAKYLEDNKAWDLLPKEMTDEVRCLLSEIALTQNFEGLKEEMLRSYMAHTKALNKSP